MEEASLMGNISTVIEAFTPSGTELPDHSQGLYTGDEDTIKQWVSENSECGWDPQHIKLMPRTVHRITPEALNYMRQARKDVEEAKQRLAKAKKGEV